MKGTIDLEGMVFHSYHGCLEHEKREGNHFEVDFKGVTDMTAAASSDRLEDTIDYGRIYNIIAAEMEQPSELLEHVCARIVTAISEAEPGLEEFEVRVSKKNPPVSGPARWSRVTIKQKKNG